MHLGDKLMLSHLSDTNGRGPKKNGSGFDALICITLCTVIFFVVKFFLA